MIPAVYDPVRNDLGSGLRYVWSRLTVRSQLSDTCHTLRLLIYWILLRMNKSISFTHPRRYDKISRIRLQSTDQSAHDPASRVLLPLPAHVSRIPSRIPSQHPAIRIALYIRPAHSSDTQPSNTIRLQHQHDDVTIIYMNLNNKTICIRVN